MNIRVVLIRGIPGSGKTTIAQMFVNMGFALVEADQYPEFWESGSYYFKPEAVAKAHEWCFEQYKSILEMSTDTGVVVANTFVNLHHMEPYISYCKERNIAYHILISDMRNLSVHRVPVSTMRRMIENFEFSPWQDVLTNVRKLRAIAKGE